MLPKLLFLLLPLLESATAFPKARMEHYFKVKRGAFPTTKDEANLQWDLSSVKPTLPPNMKQDNWLQVGTANDEENWGNWQPALPTDARGPCTLQILHD